MCCDNLSRTSIVCGCGVFENRGGGLFFRKLVAMSRSSCRATVVNTVTALGKTKEKIVYEKCADKRLFTILTITITKKLIKTQRQCLSLLLVPACHRPGSGVHVYTVAVAYGYYHRQRVERVGSHRTACKVPETSSLNSNAFQLVPIAKNIETPEP